MNKRKNMEEVEYNEYVQKTKTKHNENMTDNIEEIDLANHEAEKFITIFDKAFGGNHEKKMKMKI